MHMKERMKKTGYPSIDRVHLRGVPEEKLHPKVMPYSMLAAYTVINEGHWQEPLLEQGDRKYSKEAFRDAATSFAAALLGLGIVSGAKIAIATHNCAEGIIATFGANAVGVAVVMVEPTFETNPERFYEEVKMHQPKAVLIEGRDVATACRILGAHSLMTRFIVVGDCEIYAEDVIHFDQLSKWAVGTELVAGEIKKHSLAGDNNPILYLKTSGSTSGIPKTLPFTNLAIFAALMFASCSTGTKTRDETSGRAFCNAPFQHGYGWMPLFVNLIGGNEVVLVGSKAEDVAKYHTLNPGRIYGTPLTLRQMIESTPSDADLSSLTKFFCAGAAMPEEEYEAGIAFFREHGSSAEILNNYGISEAMCVGTFTDGVPHKAGTIGWFYYGPEWLIVNDNLEEVKYGETGEIIVSSPTLCQGYFNDPDATEESFITIGEKVWFKTGDFAFLGEDRYVRFSGRKRRFYFAEGVTDKVNCETIEQTLSSLPGVKQAAVVIMKGEGGTEWSRAFIEVSGEPTQVTAESVRKGAAQKLQPWQMPREIVVIDKLPVMQSGKVNYHLLEQYDH